jgi:hypothetical protein
MALGGVRYCNLVTLSLWRHPDRLPGGQRFCRLAKEIAAAHHSGHIAAGAAGDIGHKGIAHRCAHHFAGKLLADGEAEDADFAGSLADLAEGRRQLAGDGAALEQGGQLVHLHIHTFKPGVLLCSAQKSPSLPPRAAPSRFRAGVWRSV